MPSKKVHGWTSSVAGGVLALHRTAGQSSADSLAEVVGAVLGGFLGGMMPDRFDPPTSPNHRALAHSAGLALLALPRMEGALLSWESYFRNLLDEVRKCKDQQKLDLGEILLGLLEILFRTTAGVAAGVVAGYSAHLFLDGLTSKGLPLIA